LIQISSDHLEYFGLVATIPPNICYDTLVLPADDEETMSNSLKNV